MTHACVVMLVGLFVSLPMVGSGLAGASGGHAPRTPRYVLSDLGRETYPVAINKHGVVLVNDGVHGGAFLWTAAAGARPLDPEERRYWAVDLNHHGSVVVHGAMCDGFMRPALWTPNGGFQCFSGPGAGEIFLHAMNDRHEFVGRTWDEEGVRPQRPLYIQSVTSEPVILQEAFGFANDINNRGEAIGFYEVGHGVYDVFRYTSTNGQLTILNPAVTPTAINDAGVIGGWQHLWVKDRAIDIGRFRDCHQMLIQDISNTMHAVGWASCGDPDAEPGGNYWTAAFAWVAGQLIDLTTAVGDPAWQLLSADRVNVKGQIVGLGLYQGREYRGFVLTPQWQHHAGATR